ncbi:MAG: MerR family transcriptional regulator [Mangrovicoccus sp.]
MTTDKAPDAFRTIGEVAEWLGTPAHVLRFWESRFPQISPVKRAGGRRYYRPEDVQLLGGIKTLLHDQNLPIKSVLDQLENDGVASVCAMAPPVSWPEPTTEKPDAITDTAPRFSLMGAAGTNGFSSGDEDELPEPAVENEAEPVSEPEAEPQPSFDLSAPESETAADQDMFGEDELAGSGFRSLRHAETSDIAPNDPAPLDDEISEDLDDTADSFDDTDTSETGSETGNSGEIQGFFFNDAEQDVLPEVIEASRDATEDTELFSDVFAPEENATDEEAAADAAFAQSIERLPADDSPPTAEPQPDKMPQTFPVDPVDPDLKRVLPSQLAELRCFTAAEIKRALGSETCQDLAQRLADLKHRF